MRTFINTVLLTTLTAACATHVEPADQVVPTPPGNGIRPIYNVPGGSAVAELLFGPGSSFMLTGPTSPGSASFAGAPVTDVETEPTSSGTGALQLTVDGQPYASSTLDSFAVLLDDSPVSYVALVGNAYRPGPNASTLIDQVLVIVPQSDVAVGATVALDGNERVALFVSGDPDTGEVSVFAAAVTGTVTFSAGSLALGGTISASVAGDFGSIDWVEPGPGPGPGPISSTLTDGAYTLAVTSAADVYCEGSLAGQEAAFASITAASLGLTGGAVAIGNGGLSISGAAIDLGFATTSLELSEVDSGLYAGFTDANAPGPVGTTFVGKYLVLDAGSASPTFVNGGVGAGYVTDDGQCSVAFGATLTAP